jgi:hypothetical protein
MYGPKRAQVPKCFYPSKIPKNKIKKFNKLLELNENSIFFTKTYAGFEILNDKPLIR